MTTSFESEEMAAGYARNRPPVHERVFELLEARGGKLQVGRALDLGCGAGLSTRVLQGRASQAIGLDPSPSMLYWAKELVPGAAFVAGAAEAIPLESGTTELVTAAGSLNYSEWKTFFVETARVLTPEGRLVIYDFEPGRSFRDIPDLDQWFEEFAAKISVAKRGRARSSPGDSRDGFGRLRIRSAGAISYSDRDDSRGVR